MSIPVNTDGGPLEPGALGADTSPEAGVGPRDASGEPAERERVERAGFPYPIRRCPPREMGQR